jgi:hypothetical protein
LHFVHLQAHRFGFRCIFGFLREFCINLLTSSAPAALSLPADWVAPTGYERRWHPFAVQAMESGIDTGRQCAQQGLETAVIRDRPV